MTTMQRDPLVDDYLRRLEAAAAHLPRARRSELVGEIEEHIEAALREAGDDETAVRNVLERLGPPEEIAAAAGPPAAAPERGRLETTALIVLCVSFVLPVVGYLIGAGLVLARRRGVGREKAIGLLIPPFVVLAGVIILLVVAPSSAETRPRPTYVVDVGPWSRRPLARPLSGFSPRATWPRGCSGLRRREPEDAVVVVLRVAAAVAVARRHVEVAVGALGDVAQAAVLALEQLLVARQALAVEESRRSCSPTRLANTKSPATTSRGARRTSRPTARSRPGR